MKRNGIIAERFFDTFLNIEKFQIHDTYQGLIRSIQQLEQEKRRLHELEKKKVIESKQNLVPLVDNTGDTIIIVVKDQESLDSEEDQLRQYRQHQRSQQPFSLGVWCEYAEKEYDLLILSEQCSSVDSDWSIRNNELEDDEEDAIFQAASENNIMSVARKEVIPSINHSDLDVLESRLSDEEVESPMQESSDDHESDSSAPSTPVMHDQVDNKKWMDNDGTKVIDDTSSWIWHSAVNSE